MTERPIAKTPGAQISTSRLVLGLTAGALLVNAAVLALLARSYGALFTSLKWQAGIGASALAGLLLSALLLWARGARASFLDRMAQRVRALGVGLGPAGVVVFILLLPVLPLATAQSIIKTFEPLSMRIVLWWLLALVGAIALLGLRTRQPFMLRVAFSGVTLAVAYQIANYVPSISDYPLSLGWSEASRYYNASLFFAQRLYGEAMPWPVLHPSRYLLQAVPFLLGDLPLWVHRLWQVLLWIAVTWMTAASLAGRAGLESRWARLALAGFCYLFLMQGPVYYHLLLSAWIVLVGASGNRPRRTLLLVILASAWAGISRVNWYPVPAILAITVHLLEVPMPPGRSRVAYIGWPTAHAGAGVLAAFAASRTYAALSGNPIEQFGSSFTSDLLWYRLLPSATYPLGVLPGILIASAACLTLLILWARHHPLELHALRWLGIAGALGVLFMGGLVVSAKIGGGGNLHNLDAYLVVLLLVAIYMAFDRVVPDVASRAVWQAPRWLLGLALLIPVAFALAGGRPWSPPDQAYGKATVAAIREAVAQASQAGQRVLFINERHLIVFEHLPVRLEPDYEKVYLMEMAMANNQAYLRAFADDLANHRFDLIITERPSTVLHGSERMFGEENDVWARRVAAPLLRHYKMAVDLGGLWLMVPR